jgi:predicted dehydrogenase
MDPVRVGIIGAGMIAHRSHAEAFQALPGVEVAAVADVDEPRARAFAEKYQIPQVFTDYETMLARAEVDAVSVPLPVFLHAPATIAALRAGKHVLCEKPMARNSEEAQAMVDAARASGKKLAVYWRHRFGAQAIKARQLIESGELGRVYYVRTVGLRWRGRPSFDARMTRFGKWFGSVEQAGGGPLMDIGGYALDLVMGLLGFPRVHSASAVTFREIDRERMDREGYDVEDLAVGLIRLENGTSISIESSFAGNIDGPNGTWLFGTQAGLHLSESRTLTLFRDRDGEKETVPIDTSQVVGTTATAEFIRAIRDDTPIRTSSGEEALIVTRIQETLYRSAAAGREVLYDGTGAS